jgi:hypothetical protein
MIHSTELVNVGENLHTSIRDMFGSVSTETPDILPDIFLVFFSHFRKLPGKYPTMFTKTFFQM